jgi:pseudouridine synthase
MTSDVASNKIVSNKSASDKSDNTERIQKILAKRNVASRRAAEQMILDGRVSLNGRIAELGDKADPNVDELLLDGKPLPPLAEHRYVLLYKPAGFITSVGDPRGRRTVMDLLPKSDRLYPVGRLDYATSGALLLTNDGDMANALLHPRHEVTKVYECAVCGRVSDEKLTRLANGVLLDDGMTAPAKARRKKQTREQTVVELAIHEGRNRQVRRMMAALGLEVVWLKRSSFAGLNLHGMKPGDWRDLTEPELAFLLKLK